MCEDRIKAGTQGCSVGHGQSRSSGWSSPTTRRTRLPKASLPTLLSSLIFVRVTVQFESFRKLKHTTCQRWRFVQSFWNILYVLASVACAQHQTGWIFGTSGFTQTCWRHTTFMLSLRTCHVFFDHRTCRGDEWGMLPMSLHLHALTACSQFDFDLWTIQYIIYWIIMNNIECQYDRSWLNSTASSVGAIAWSYSTCRPEFHHSHFSVCTIQHTLVDELLYVLAWYVIVIVIIGVILPDWLYLLL